MSQSNKLLKIVDFMLQIQSPCQDHKQRWLLPYSEAAILQLNCSFESNVMLYKIDHAREIITLYDIYQLTLNDDPELIVTEIGSWTTTSGLQLVAAKDFLDRRSDLKGTLIVAPVIHVNPTIYL